MAEDLLERRSRRQPEPGIPFPSGRGGFNKRKRYAEYGAPLYLLVDRQNRELTLFSEPGELGYTKADGPHPFGTPVTLPEPFGIVLDTTRL